MELISHNGIILELKAVKVLAPEHMAQVINYLKATNLKLGLLINFGSHPKVQLERFALWVQCFLCFPWLYTGDLKLWII